MAFGEKLKALRRATGKSQMQVIDEISALFGNHRSISQTTLSNLEMREDLPKRDLLEMICKYYSVPTAYFNEHNSLHRNLALDYIRSLERR